MLFWADLNIDNVRKSVTVARPPAQFNTGKNKRAVLHLCNFQVPFWEDHSQRTACHLIFIWSCSTIFSPWVFIWRVRVRCFLIGGSRTDVSLGTGKQEIYEWQVPHLFIAQGSNKHPAPCPNSSLRSACRGGIGWLIACDHTPTAVSHRKCPQSVYFYNRSASH